MPTPNELIRQTLRRVNVQMTSGYSSKLLGLLNDGEAFAASLLEAATASGHLTDPFDRQQVDIFRSQMRLATRFVQRRLDGVTQEHALKSMRTSIWRTAKLTKQLEPLLSKRVPIPIRIDRDALERTVSRRLATTILKRSESSARRYGDAMIAEFNRVIREGLRSGATQAEMVDALIMRSQATPEFRRRISQAQPAWSPQRLVGFRQRQSWAERIVRTETANAVNASNLRSMHHIKRTALPDLKKKILATFDARTADDSIGVHGQVRGLRGKFRDGAGRSYLRPPARPNDREIVIPWREAWRNTTVTKERAPSNVP